MRILLLAIAALLLALPAFAAELLIVQSQNRPAYDQSVRLIQNNCASGAETLVMSNYAEFDLDRIVREEQPRVVIAVGEQAFKKARNLRRTPVVYALTLNVNENSLGTNINGVSMHVVPDKYMQIFKKLQLRRIAVLYDKRHSGAYLARARKAAAAAGIDLIALEVRSPRDVPATLDHLEKLAVNGLWMIPDSSAVAPESVDTYFHFAQKHNLPVISFARGYLEKGAVAILEGSRKTIADQGCSMIRQIRGGILPTAMATVDIREAALVTNGSVANRLQLNLAGLELLFPLPPE